MPDRITPLGIPKNISENPKTSAPKPPEHFGCQLWQPRPGESESSHHHPWLVLANVQTPQLRATLFRICDCNPSASVAGAC